MSVWTFLWAEFLDLFEKIYSETSKLPSQKVESMQCVLDTCADDTWPICHLTISRGGQCSLTDGQNLRALIVKNLCTYWMVPFPCLLSLEHVHYYKSTWGCGSASFNTLLPRDVHVAEYHHQLLSPVLELRRNGFIWYVHFCFRVLSLSRISMRFTCVTAFISI